MNTSGIRMLIVDDEKTLVWAMRENFEEQRMQVVTAADGREALLKIAAGTFDAVITDLKMPDVSGIEVARAAREKNPGAVIIILTAFGSFETAVEALRLGVDDYLAKPFKLENLTQAVRQALEKKKISATATAAVSTGDGTPAASHAFRAVESGRAGTVVSFDSCKAAGRPGEFFNFHQTDTTTVWFFAGKVTGSANDNVEALGLLSAGFLRSALTQQDKTPRDIMLDLNEALRGAKNSTCQLHFFCAECDLDNDIISYAAGGDVGCYFFNFKTLGLSTLNIGPALALSPGLPPALGLNRLNVKTGDQLLLSLSPADTAGAPSAAGLLEKLEHLAVLGGHKLARKIKDTIVQYGQESSVVTLCVNKILSESPMARFELDSDTKHVVWKAKALVEMLCRELGMSVSSRHATVTAASEIIINSLIHGYEGRKDKLVLEFQLKDGVICISVQDFGKGFDLRTYRKPDVDSVEGILDPDCKRGLFIAQNCVDKLEIASSPRTGTVTKLFQPVKKG